MSKIIVIGASGKKNAGKDTFLDIVREEALRLGYAVRTRSPGDRIREELAPLLADAFMPHPEYGALTWLQRHDLALCLMKENGATKEGALRKLQQAWGMLRREFFDPDYLLADFQASYDALTAAATQVPLVLLNPSVRFPDEVEAVQKLGGVVVRIEASYPGYEVTDNDPTETALDDYFGFDFLIENDSTVEDFQKKAVYLALHLLDTYGV